jgi:hypothetical protein
MGASGCSSIRFQREAGTVLAQVPKRSSGSAPVNSGRAAEFPHEKQPSRDRSGQRSEGHASKVSRRESARGRVQADVEGMHFVVDLRPSARKVSAGEGPVLKSHAVSDKQTCMADDILVNSFGRQYRPALRWNPTGTVPDTLPIPFRNPIARSPMTAQLSLVLATAPYRKPS